MSEPNRTATAAALADAAGKAAVLSEALPYMRRYARQTILVKYGVPARGREADGAGPNIEKVLEIGFVGEPETISTKVLEPLERSDIIPVIAPIGVGADGETFNINADPVAGAVAAAMDATRLLLLTDIAGVLDREKRLISEMSAAQARALIADGTISGGMIPKVETCLEADDGGVRG